jgi:hypothetical protein
MPVDFFADLGFGGEQGVIRRLVLNFSSSSVMTSFGSEIATKSSLFSRRMGNDRQPYRPFPGQQLENFGIDLARGWLYHVDAELAG